MINENRKICVDGVIVSPEDKYVISKMYQYANFNYLACNHMKADTRVIFHLSELHLRHTDNLQVITEFPDTGVIILLLSHYKYFVSNYL